MRKSARAIAKRRGTKAGDTPRAKGRRRRGRDGERTDWARGDATTDAQITHDVAHDPDAAPEFTDEMFSAARRVTPARRTQIALKVDPEVLAFFKAPGPGYQTRMNEVLRAYMEKARSGRG